jgi:hypothetical protein
MEVLYLSETLLPTDKSARRHKTDYNHEEFYGSKNHKYSYIFFKIAETDRKMKETGHLCLQFFQSPTNL